MRFLLDNDVDVEVGTMLRSLGHECWTAADAKLEASDDDQLTVYSVNRSAVLITHDRAFSQRRRKNVVGRHVELRCDEWDAADLLRRHLDEVLALLGQKSDIFVAVSTAGCEFAYGWR